MRGRRRYATIGDADAMTVGSSIGADILPGAGAA